MEMIRFVKLVLKIEGLGGKKLKCPRQNFWVLRPIFDKNVNSKKVRSIERFDKRSEVRLSMIVHSIIVHSINVHSINVHSIIGCVDNHLRH